jgi:hypothetical protein
MDNLYADEDESLFQQSRRLFTSVLRDEVGKIFSAVGNINNNIRADEPKKNQHHMDHEITLIHQHTLRSS